MNKLTKILISFVAGYAVGKLAKGTDSFDENTSKNIKPINIDANHLKSGNLGKLFDELKKINLEVPEVNAKDVVGESKKSGKSNIYFENGKHVLRNETDTRIFETITDADGITFKITSKIDEIKKEINDIKEAVGELSERIVDYEDNFCALSEEVRKIKNKTNKE